MSYTLDEALEVLHPAGQPLPRFHRRLLILTVMMLLLRRSVCVRLCRRLVFCHRLPLNSV